MAEDIRQSTSKQTTQRQQKQQNTKTASNHPARDANATNSNQNEPRSDNRNDNRNSNRNNNRSYERTRFSNNNNNNNRKNQQKQALNDDSDTSSNRRNKLISVCSSTGGGVTCVCCLHELSTFAYYACSHFVCLKCAVKMRVLCEKIDCPVCRQESKQIYCVKSEIDMASLQASIEQCAAKDEKAGIYFENDLIQVEYEQILANRCNICSNLFATFDELERHVRIEHRKFYCELCITHLKLFPYERKVYNREDLAIHKRVGDKDDYSFKGHPLCEYCDQRFFDRDEIYRHYRKEHYYCHFCDNDGHEEYYKDYAQLRAHFLKSHYLCELDTCSANAATTHEYVVFRSELDFMAHKKQKHAKSKSDMKSFGKINIEFNLSNPHRDKKMQRRGGGASGFGRGAQRFSPDEEAQTSSKNVESDRQARPHQAASRTGRQHAEQSATSSIFDLAQFEPLSVDEPTKKLETKEEKFTQLETNASNNKPTQATSSTLIDQAEESKKPVVQSQQQSGWSTILGAGSMPKLNTEVEFPSLNATTQPLSLSQIGAFIGKTSAWNKPTVHNASNNTTNQKKEKKVNPFPDLTETKVESSLLDENWIKNDEKKAKKHKKKKATESKLAKESDDELKPSPPVPPPPGFEPNSLENFSQLSLKTSSLKSTLEPPPGFASKAPTNTSTNTTVTTTSVQPTREYLKPNDYDQRNQELSLQLVELFPSKHFEQFKTLSISFRKNELNANDYLDKCLDLLDVRKSDLARSKFLDLVQEMIVLLPDIDKQSVLFEHFERLFHKKSKQQSSYAENMVSIVKCANCGQYFQKKELFAHHFDQHGGQIATQSGSNTNKQKHSRTVENEDFPALKPVSNALASSSTTMSSIFKSPLESKEEKKATKHETSKTSIEEEFPALSSIPSELLSQNRFSALPTPSIFSNPSSHLSILNKKKHRLQK